MSASKIKKYRWLQILVIQTISIIVSIVFSIITYACYPEEVKNFAPYIAFIVGTIITFTIPTWATSINSEVTINEVKDQISDLNEVLKKTLHSNANNNHSFSRTSLINDVISRSEDEIYKTYNSKFDRDETGFKVVGQEWSLEAYEVIWRHLVQTQKELCTKKSKHFIICRITHSTDITIWSTKKELSATAMSLLQLQKDFVEFGGKIIRVIIHPNEKPSEDYLQVEGDMRKANIITRLVPVISNAEYNYDFLWASTNESALDCHGDHNIQVIVKWHPGNHGVRLKECEITNIVDNDLRRLWRLYANLANVTEIPEDRNTF
jgi:hypothetical protein